ncbi:dienelactone hydrolase family protein [Mycobacterium crocinum]|uniref:Dienelactone hydrolase family protein n=1 Tax=Mycolicibacterium crocinum TaxID=388459 RepID=A0ABY3TID1_9MYCO|nr:dienelactone hydrolase family protein [Mycolicibacterium crocinum]MCV7216813.1 dienelactone hydrolase family protein [Mycolicibacterium crocinum]ULN40084.1 dienelactone hydrolase family protein [Mycolicibacterium crocinum]
MDITYPAPAGPLPAYEARPTGAGPWPGVVIVHDAMGFSRDVKRITDRFADNGYLAITPALYHRGNRLLCVVRTVLAGRNGTGTAVDDLIAARDYLVADPECTGKVGVIGFCMGGGFCLVLGPTGLFDASAPNYGEWPKDISAIPNSCPTVASYGARDRMLPGAAAKLEDLLAERDVPRDIKEYPNVGHSFMNQFPTPGPLKVIERVAGLEYSEPEAEDAWQRILAFFGEHLTVAGSCDT